ncbi:MAG: ATP synthase subunit I [Ginsengibacter sp.]
MILALIGGMLLGVIFFGGLWLTVKKIIKSKTPALLMLSSFIFRIVIVLVGFYIIGLGDWKKLIICLIGFIIARFVVIYYTKSIDERELQLKTGVDHET